MMKQRRKKKKSVLSAFKSQQCHKIEPQSQKLGGMADTFSLTQISSAPKSSTVPITGLEEKELRRVYDKLCDYQVRLKCKDSISQMEMGIKLIKNQSQGRETEQTIELQKNIDGLRKELSDVEAKPDHFISCNDVFEMLKTLRQKTDKKRVEEMIWEIDEDLDGQLSWSEFRLMYNRNIMDTTGLEPSKMFNLVQFLIYDKNENNRVSVDETMNMLYARYSSVVCYLSNSCLLSFL